MQRKVFIRVFHEKISRYIEYIGYYDDEKYIVDYRAWHKNDGTYARYWLPNEYLKCNPNNLKTIHYLDDNDNSISAECHCIESRAYIVKMNNGLPLPRICNTRLFDYQEQKFLDIPKNYRCWATPEEYDGWEFGINKRYFF